MMNCACKNDELFIKNVEFCIENDELRIDFCTNVMHFVFQMVEGGPVLRAARSVPFAYACAHLQCDLHLRLP